MNFLKQISKWWKKQWCKHPNLLTDKPMRDNFADALWYCPDCGAEWEETDFIP